MAIAVSPPPLAPQAATYEGCTDVPSPLTVHTEQHDDGWRVSISGELDMSTASLVERELLDTEARDSRPILIDLRRMTFMGAVGIHLLLAATSRSRARSRRLTILRGSTAVQRVFEVTRTAVLLPFADR